MVTDESVDPHAYQHELEQRIESLKRELRGYREGSKTTYQELSALFDDLKQDRDRLAERLENATQSGMAVLGEAARLKQDSDRLKRELKGMASRYEQLRLIMKRFQVQFRCNRLPGGPDNEAEFIELETWDGKGLGPSSGWQWLKDGDSYILTSKPQPVTKREPCPDPDCVTNGGHKACWGKEEALAADRPSKPSHLEWCALHINPEKGICDCFDQKEREAHGIRIFEREHNNFPERDEEGKS